MKRCLNSKCKYYHNYGGRGITVCTRWHSFVNFLEDMGECPKGLTIERIDNEGNYEPNNCRWATRKEQCRNLRKNRMVTFNGETRCLSEWAEITGLTYATLMRRLNSGKTGEQLFSRLSLQRGYKLKTAT